MILPLSQTTFPNKTPGPHGQGLISHFGIQCPAQQEPLAVERPEASSCQLGLAVPSVLIQPGALPIRPPGAPCDSPGSLFYFSLFPMPGIEPRVFTLSYISSPFFCLFVFVF